MKKLQNLSSIADERGQRRGRARVDILRFELGETRGIPQAGASAGGNENSHEIGVPYVGDHWLVSYTSLTRERTRPSL